MEEKIMEVMMIKDIIENNENKNINQDKINQLKQIIPNCFDRNGNLDIELFKKEFDSELTFTKESFELNFLGKSYAKMIAGLDTETVIEPDLKHNSLEENKNSENIYISGDNIDALKHLVKAYEGKIKCIYIDPPYNTGSDGFVYNDTFKFTKELLIEKLDIGEDEAERIISMTSGSSSSHSAWLTFMYPRLYLSKQLLKDEGVIFISIDDNEQSNLKLLCDTIYGQENFIGMFAVENNPKGRKNSKFISVSSEYCIVYAKVKFDEKSGFIENIPKSENDMTKDENGNYIHSGGRRVLVGENDFNNEVKNFQSDKHYSVYYNEQENDMIMKTENSIEEIDSELISIGYKRYYSYREKYFVENTYTKQKLIEMFENDELDFKNDKIYEKNLSTTIRIKSLLTNRKYNAIINNKIVNNYELDFKTTSAGTKLKEMFNSSEVPFSAPKNYKFIQLLLSLFESKDFVCLDFFGGSGTTAEAIMRLNASDSGNRKYILVQLPENLKENYEKATGAGKKTIRTQMKILEAIGKPLFLDEIGQERIKRAAAKIKEETNANIDYGFKHYTLKETSDNVLTKLEKFDSNIINENYDLYKEYGINTILETWKLKDGYEFTTNIETIDCSGYNIYKCGECLYLIEPNITIKNIESLLEQYSNNEKFTCNKLVLFGYSFKFNELEMIKNNIKQVKNFKNIDVKVYTRY